MKSDSPKQQLREDILGEVHLCGCQAINARLEEVEVLEHKTTEELLKLFTAHQNQLLNNLLESLPERRDSARSCGDNFDHGFVECLKEVTKVIKGMMDV